MTMRETKKDIIVYYHADCMDGAGAAWAARQKFGDAAEYAPVNYNYKSEDLFCVRGKEVYVLDFSFPRTVLEIWIKQAKSLLVLDHHASAKDNLTGLPYAVFDMNKSGAMMAWEGFHPGTEAPMVIKHIQDRDLWKFELPGTRELSAYMRTRSASMDTVGFVYLNERAGEKAMGVLYGLGEAILDHIQAQVTEATSRAFKAWLRGTEVLCTTCCSDIASEVGSALAKLSPSKIGVIVSLSHRGAGLSIRSDGGTGARDLAEKCGGGGHGPAAGGYLNREEFFELMHTATPFTPA